MKKFIIGLVFINAFQLNAITVDYEISIPEPHTHYCEVTMNIGGVSEKYLDIKMPVWAPGSYLIREFSKNVEEFRALGKPQGLLHSEKINKNTWRVMTDSKNEIQITYRVYAFEMSVRTSFIDAAHAYLNGTSIFMYVDEKKEISGSVKINPYKDWKTVSTSLDKSKDAEGFVYTYPNYDVLVDSPFEIGNHQVWQFLASGVDHEVAMYGEGNYEKEKLLKDMAKVVETCTAVIGENPNKSYTFIIHNLNSGRGGLEHLGSTTLQADRFSYGTDKGYHGFLSLVAHEYFHLWNVKRIRPEALGPFNYDEENYTTLLWVMEGFTSYYDELLLVKAGFYKEENYLKLLETGINGVERTPGNKVQTLAESSFDAWIKYYRRDENAYNTQVSYYSKGAVIAALIDIEIIAASAGKQNLDDLMRDLYTTYYKGEKRGFTEEEFKKMVEKYTKKDMSDFFNKYVNGTETPDYKAYFSKVGIATTLSEEEKWKMGLNTKEEEGKLMVSSVLRNTPAYNYGVNVNDEVLAINTYRVNDKNLSKLFEEQKKGEVYVLTVVRDGKLLDLKIKKEAITEKNYKLAISSKENKNFKKWMFR